MNIIKDLKYLFRNLIIKNWRKIRYKCYKCCDTGWIWTDLSIYGHIPCDCSESKPCIKENKK